MGSEPRALQDVGLLMLKLLRLTSRVSPVSFRDTCDYADNMCHFLLYYHTTCVWEDKVTAAVHKVSVVRAESA
jgi:hypothetical protein